MTEQSGSGGAGSNPGQGYGGEPPPYPNQPQPSGQPQYPGQQEYPGQQPYPNQPPPYPGAGQPTYQQPGYPPPPPAGYGGAPGYPTYPGFDEPVKRGYSGWAIAAFVTGLIPAFVFLAAIPLGIVALVKIARHGLKGRWMAITGLVLAAVWIAIGVSFAVWWNTSAAQRNDAGVITEAGHLDFGDIRTGDCVKIDGLAGGGEISAFDLEGVPCDDLHNAQAIFVVEFPGDKAYPGEGSIANEAQQACFGQYQQFRGSGLTPYTLYPTSSRWGQSDGHRAICFVTQGGANTMTGSVLTGSG